MILFKFNDLPTGRLINDESGYLDRLGTFGIPGLISLL